MSGEQEYRIVVDKFVFKIRRGYHYSRDDS